MHRLPIILLASLIVVSGAEGAVAEVLRGKVVKTACSTSRNGYIRCRSRRLRTTVDVALIEVDGSVSMRSVATNRAGRFRLKVRSGYYVAAPRPPVLGMPTESAEVTVPPQGSTITLKVDAR